MDFPLPVFRNLRPGDILHVRSAGLFARLIRRVCRSEGNHDAIVLPPDAPGLPLLLGESLVRTGRSVVTPIGTWAASHIASGEARAAVLRFPAADPFHALGACSWWRDHVEGKPYDILAFPRLFLKATLVNVPSWSAGLPVAWYCTEGVRDAWRNGAGAPFDPWRQAAPTPRHTEDALRDPWSPLVDVTASCIPNPAHRLLLPPKDPKP